MSCEQQNELYDVKGTVRSIDIESNNVIIAHDTIVDMMPMVVPFKVLNNKVLDSLQVGDSVHFEFVWDESKPFARHFNIVGIGNIRRKTAFLMMNFLKSKLGIL